MSSNPTSSPHSEKPNWIGILARIVAIQAPVLAAVGLTWEKADTNPAVKWWLIAGIVTWEILAIIAASSRNFISILWKQEFEKDAVAVTASWIRRSFPSPGREKKYRRTLQRRYCLFNDSGLGLNNTFRLELNKVFVNLSIARATTVEGANRNLLGRGTNLETGSHSIWDYIRELGKDRKARDSGLALAIAVIGAAGSGKTTLLQHMVFTLASNKHRRHCIPAKLPALLNLRTVQNSLKLVDNEGSPESLPSLAKILHLHTAEETPGLNLPELWFESKMDQGDFLVLLDGLDEIGDETRRREVCAWLDNQIVRYNRCQLVVTSRPHGYDITPLRRANVLEVRHFSPAQVRQFVFNWYHANEFVRRGNIETAEVLEKSRDEAQLLLKAVSQSAAIQALTANPLLLTMICMVHRYRGELPGGRRLLYEEICKVLLERWRRGIDPIGEKLDAEQKLLILMPLAAHMMKTFTREIDTSAAERIFARPLRRLGLQKAQQIGFLERLARESGLLFEDREIGQWSFAHLTFQEFLTARWWTENRPSESELEELVGQSWWHETLRLYVSQADASPVVEACLKFPNQSTILALAFQCLEQAREVDPKLRVKVRELVEKGLESDDPTKFSAAADAWFEIKSKDFTQIGDGVELRTSPVSFSEYQQFLLAGDAQRVPDQWLQHNPGAQSRFPQGRSQDPIRGLRKSDQLAFLDWLNKRETANTSIGTVSFRYSLHDEIAGPDLLEHGAIQDMSEIGNGRDLSASIDYRVLPTFLTESHFRLRSADWALCIVYLARNDAANFNGVHNTNEPSGNQRVTEISFGGLNIALSLARIVARELNPTPSIVDINPPIQKSASAADNSALSIGNRYYNAFTSTLTAIWVTIHNLVHLFTPDPPIIAITDESSSQSSPLPCSGSFTSKIATALATNLSTSLASTSESTFEVAKELARELAPAIPPYALEHAAEELKPALAYIGVFVKELSTSANENLDFRKLQNAAERSLDLLRGHSPRVPLAENWMRFWESLAKICLAAEGDAATQREAALIFSADILLFIAAWDEAVSNKVENSSSEYRHLGGIFRVPRQKVTKDPMQIKETRRWAAFLFQTAHRYRGTIPEGDPFYIARERIDLTKGGDALADGAVA